MPVYLAKSIYLRLASCIIAAFLLLTGVTAVSAMEPPRKGELQRLARDGKLKARLDRARVIGNHKFSPQLVYDFAKRNKALRSGFAPPPAWQGGMPASGTPKTLVLLVDFPDYPSDATNTVNFVNSQMFGTGIAANFPYESLTNYYKRSSYNALTIQGNVLGWYRASQNRSYYQGLGDGPGQRALMKEAINYYNTQGHDFSQYDNNGDGYIDIFYLKWTGPDNGWANFWWAYQWSFNDGSYVIDGKRFGKYIWSWVANANYDGQTLYRPRVDIHETGHALGLPDFYDYDGNVGPDGGVGGLDMMHGNYGDHNAFSKAMLGWLTPTVVSSGTQSIALSPTATHPQSVMIMPSSTGNIFSEYFVAQYRKRSSSAGNDSFEYPTDGLTIWHVDATLNAGNTDFLYNNSYTSHKLLRLMEADGLEEIENNGNADAGDFFVSPKTFTPTTSPNSNRYSGTSTNVQVSNLSAAGATLSATFSIGTPASTVAIGDAANSVLEGDGTITIPVTRSSTSGTASVDFATADGSALAGADYTGQTSTLNFADGVATADITIAISDDADEEATEGFSVALSNPSSGMTLAAPSTASISILDNDATPVTALPNGVAVSSLSGAPGSDQYYSIAVPAGARKLWIALSGGTGNADLYVKNGSLPDAVSYDCRPNLAGNRESCSSTLPMPGTYYIMVRGSSSFTGATLVATYTKTKVRALQSGVRLGKLRGAKGSKKYFALGVPAGASNLKITTRWGTGNVDLYARLGATPTTTAYGCASRSATNRDTCSSASPQPGVYFVMLRGKNAYSGVKLLGTYTISAATKSKPMHSASLLVASDGLRNPE